jgi:hypothetical protein
VGVRPSIGIVVHPVLAEDATYPFSKVGKQLQDGADDSVLPFFTAIPALFATARPSKPWWKFWGA